LSTLNVSTAVCAILAADLVAASSALSVWLRNAGMGIAARMPMIR
jgi:hypothetical protein